MRKYPTKCTLCDTPKPRSSSPNCRRCYIRNQNTDIRYKFCLGCGKNKSFNKYQKCMDCRINPRTISIEMQLEKFIKKTDGCWEWTGSRDGKGYGRIRQFNKLFPVHRLMHEKYNGPIPKGFNICHKCDNKICCRPDHLFIGSARDNAIDAAKKGILARKLTKEDIFKIRKSYKNGVKQKELAKKFNVVNQMISNIVLRKSWDHVI